MSFLVPNSISQDLLLIRDIIGIPEPPPEQLPPEDDIDSSGSEVASEDEVEADLIKVEEDPKPILSTSGSLPESDSSSDSDSSESEDEDTKATVRDLDGDADEDSGVAAPTASYFQTKNEIPETNIVVPDIDEVGSEEQLERVGEVMSIMDKVVIVKGAPLEGASRTSDLALDCDTLLVFEDRKVLGYIYETFGPTSQPMYQVKFSATYPIVEDRVQLSRPVFHVPGRSNFVSVARIKMYKGSDASNLHDEEPADDELDFSDDEAEAAYKSNLKRKRAESRANSVAASRGSTPSPAFMRDQDLAFTEGNPYDDYGPYDDNFGSGPSRPSPMPYNDPYSDEYNVVPSVDAELPAPPRPVPRNRSASNDNFGSSAGRSRGRGRARGLGFERNDGRGRGRGRDRAERGRGSRGRGSNDRPLRYDDWSQPPSPMEPYDSRPPLSPTSLAIARATGQFPDSSELSAQAHSMPNSPTTPWGSDPSQQFIYPYQQPFVQPHINPRFASAFGINFNFQHLQPQQPYQQPPPSGGSWTDEWTVHSGNEPSTNP